MAEVTPRGENQSKSTQNPMRLPVLITAIGALMLGLANAALGGEAVDVWVVLAEQPAGGSPTAGQLERVKRQQDRVMAELRLLGATELARVSLARNALAVTIDSSQLAAVKRISGVRSISRVRDIEREPGPPSR
jgi:hypothetical protein